MTSENQQILDLRLIHECWQFGDILCIMSWTLHDRRPAMVLIPAHAPRNNESLTPCVIPVDMAYLWSDTVVGDPFHQERSAGQFAIFLGMDPMDHGLRARIITIIQNRLQDLLTMPPMPDTGETAAVADVSMRNLATGKITEVEARADV